MGDKNWNTIGGWYNEKSDTLLRGDSLTHLLPQNKFIILFPNKKQIIILDDNPTYKTIARDGFVKFNSLWLPKDTIAAKVIEVDPGIGESKVDPGKFIRVRFSEPILYSLSKFEVQENGQAKAGSFNTERGDSVIVWLPNEMFKTNARISWKVETYDVDTNKTIAEGYFYTEDPSGVEEEEKEVDGIEGRVVVYDMLGRRIKEIERDWEAKMHELSTGIYIVEINGKRRRILNLTP